MLSLYFVIGLCYATARRVFFPKRVEKIIDRIFEENPALPFSREFADLLGYVLDIIFWFFVPFIQLFRWFHEEKK